MRELYDALAAPARHARVARARAHRGARRERGALSQLHLARLRLVLGTGRPVPLHVDQRQLRPTSTGFTVDEHLGRTHWDLPDIEAPEGGWDGASRAARVARDLLRRRVAPRVHPRARADATRRSAASRCSTPTARFVGYRGIGRDVTQQKLRRGKRQPARALRHAHRSLQPRRVLRARCITRSRSRAGTASVLARALHRPRPLQGRQRRLRPRDRRRGAEDHGAAALRHDPRVATPPRAWAATSSSCSPRTSRAKRTSSDFAQRLLDALVGAVPAARPGMPRCPRASASRCSRTTATTPRRCSRKPTSRCTGPRMPARNGLAFFSEVDSRPAEERIVMGAGIRRALDTDQLRLLYQPKVVGRARAR